MHTQKQGKKEGMRLMKKKERKNRTIAAARQETTHKTARRGHVVLLLLQTCLATCQNSLGAVKKTAVKKGFLPRIGDMN